MPAATPCQATVDMWPAGTALAEYESLIGFPHQKAMAGTHPCIIDHIPGEQLPMPGTLALLQVMHYCVQHAGTYCAMFYAGVRKCGCQRGRMLTTCYAACCLQVHARAWRQVVQLLAAAALAGSAVIPWRCWSTQCRPSDSSSGMQPASRCAVT